MTPTDQIACPECGYGWNEFTHGFHYTHCSKVAHLNHGQQSRPNVPDTWCKCRHAKYNHGEDDFSAQGCNVNGCDCDGFELVEHHDTPAAPERGEWSYVETRYSAEVAINDNLRLRAHWTGTWDRDEIRTLMQGIVTEHNQHSTLIAQRERLIDALFSAVSEIEILEQALEEYHGTRQPNPTLAIIREAIAEVEQQQQVITTSEQEGRS